MQPILGHLVTFVFLTFSTPSASERLRASKATNAVCLRLLTTPSDRAFGDAQMSFLVCERSNLASMHAFVKTLAASYDACLDKVPIPTESIPHVHIHRHDDVWKCGHSFIEAFEKEHYELHRGEK